MARWVPTVVTVRLYEPNRHVVAYYVTMLLQSNAMLVTTWDLLYSKRSI